MTQLFFTRAATRIICWLCLEFAVMLALQPLLLMGPLLMNHYACTQGRGEGRGGLSIQLMKRKKGREWCPKDCIVPPPPPHPHCMLKRGLGKWLISRFSQRYRHMKLCLDFFNTAELKQTQNKNCYWVYNWKLLPLFCYYSIYLLYRKSDYVTCKALKCCSNILVVNI
jgi:hypothetical protein